MTKQNHLDETSHASSHIKENDQSYQTLQIGLIMFGPLPFLSPLRELYHFESSTMRFQWSGVQCALLSDVKLLLTHHLGGITTGTFNMKREGGLCILHVVGQVSAL